MTIGELLDEVNNMDDQYRVCYIIFSKNFYEKKEEQFDDLSSAIQRVNEIANGEFSFEYIHLLWGESLLLELYN